MAYDGSSYRSRAPGGTDPDRTPLGARFIDPVYQQDDQAYGTDESALEVSDPDGLPRRHRVPPAALGDVFDDPEHGEPGRDRLGVHLAWEAVLLVAAATLAFLVHRLDPAALRGAGLNSLLVSGTVLGALALGAGLSLRTGAPNLALGPMASASALYHAEHADQGMLQATWPLAVTAAGIGLVVAAVVVGLHVPAWAATLAAGLGLVVFVQQRTAPVAVSGGFDPTRSSVHLFAGFAAVAVLGGLLGTIKAVRRTVGRFRPVADPARRRGVSAGVLVAVALTASMLFAAFAGVLLAGAADGTVRPDPGFDWTGLAIGVALLGGTSAFGRRAGVFGTLLAVVLVTLFLRYDDLREWRIAPAATAVVVLVLGLLVTRMVESYGRPRTAVDEQWQPGDEESDSLDDWGGRHSERSRSWVAADERADSWGPDPWRDDR